MIKTSYYVEGRTSITTPPLPLYMHMFATEKQLKVPETILYNALMEARGSDELITPWLEWIIVSGLNGLSGPQKTSAQRQLC